MTHAYQALGLHELRPQFKPVFWTDRVHDAQQIEQAWFAGAHANVGGGYAQTGLSSFALEWLALKARAAGLHLDTAYLKREIKTRKADEPIALSRLIGHGEPGLINRRSYYGRLERPLTHDAINLYLDRHFGGAMSKEVFQAMKVHWSVHDRFDKKPTYTSDQATFDRLDLASQELPVVDRLERLVR